MKGLFLALVGAKAFAPNTALMAHAPRGAGTLSREERDDAILGGMPAPAREAFALGMARMAVRALGSPATPQPSAPPAPRQETIMYGSNLSAADAAAARAATARLNEPRAASERALCQQNGWDEAMFKQERDRQIVQTLPGYYPGKEHGLTKAEAETATLLSQSFEAYAAEKALQGQAARTRQHSGECSTALTAAEMQVADTLGISHADFAAEKAKLAIHEPQTHGHPHTAA